MMKTKLQKTTSVLKGNVVLKTKIVLASQSPRRIALLQQIGVDCLVMPADIDETPLPNEQADAYVIRLAQQKAQVIATQLPPEHMNDVVLGADTTVALNGEILGKPQDAQDAFNMLKKLSASTHQVHTAVAVVRNNRLETVLNTTQVEMMLLSDDMITQYIATGEPLDKAGSYAIQGLAGSWIKRIDGSYTGVMGLPVYETALLLQKIAY